MSASEDQIEEEFFDEEGVEGDSASIKKLRDKLLKAIEEKQEYLDGWQRSRADLVNFKRDEMQREGEREVRSKVDFAEAVIPALDAFEMALEDKNFKEGDENFKKGIQAVYTNLLKSLERLGITRFDPTGEPFSPHHFEALREIPTDDPQKDHTVESVHRPGYRIGERIVRAAQVSVYSHQN